jgi:hypothetical protein
MIFDPVDPSFLFFGLNAFDAFTPVANLPNRFFYIRSVHSMKGKIIKLSLFF